MSPYKIPPAPASCPPLTCIPGTAVIQAPVTPDFVIVAADGTELLRITWSSGVLDVTGPQERWTEAAARFVETVRQMLGVL